MDESHDFVATKYDSNGVPPDFGMCLFVSNLEHGESYPELVYSYLRLSFLPAGFLRCFFSQKFSASKTNDPTGNPGPSIELASPSEHCPISIPHGHHDDGDDVQEHDEDHESILESGVDPAMTTTTQRSVDKTTATSPVSLLRECAVCLEAFCDNDEICTSNNPDCPHVFHRTCIHSWLMRQEECPCCRRPYLQFDPLEEILF